MYTETQTSRVAAPLRKNHTILNVCPSGSTTVSYDGGAYVGVRSSDYIPQSVQGTHPKKIDHLDPAMLWRQSNSLYRRDQSTAARPGR